MPFPQDRFTETVYCPNTPFAGTFTADAKNISAAIYYPGSSTSYWPTVPINVAMKEKNYPVIIFAHAKRDPTLFCQAPGPGLDPDILDISKDFTRADFMLDHVCSYGCVAVVPDLSGLTFLGAFERAQVLVAMYQFLASINPLFQNRLDLNRILLCGHSTGGGSCLIARGDLVSAGGPTPLAMCLIAPAVRGSGPDLSALASSVAPNGLMVIAGAVDTMQAGVDPMAAYAAGQSPRVLITIPGANHFGYTSICSLDNKVCAASDNPGTIVRIAQELTAAAYLAALVRRFARGDQTVEPYLTGQQIVETNIFGVLGIKVQQDGM
ncbi:hypothetical protein DIE21_32895 [Burkholderia sp. Bp9140]|uniref:hypothetical protein n=1 Tax=Burkholderia sp. Bp9140 TaxID=2184572 RepID=UPI000F55E82A|nr:hypothetical protein [Burkholderia sp. Bp9140]RQR44747.1 hypothetical protein DIE21_32895 [Burkholderia sp. Bp9140]